MNSQGDLAISEYVGYVLLGSTFQGYTKPQNFTGVQPPLRLGDFLTYQREALEERNTGTGLIVTALECSRCGQQI